MSFRYHRQGGNERFGEEERKTEAAAENVTEDKAVEQKVDDGQKECFGG